MENNYFLFFLQAFFLPPVARRLCMESREIPLHHSDFEFVSHCRERKIERGEKERILPMVAEESGGGGGGVV